MSENLKLKLKKLGSSWWIVGDEVDGPYGPYSTRKEASEDAVGVMNFCVNEERRSFFTIEPKKEM